MDLFSSVNYIGYLVNFYANCTRYPLTNCIEEQHGQHYCVQIEAQSSHDKGSLSFMVDEGMIIQTNESVGRYFRCCDVSLISKFEDEYEV